MNHYTLDNTDGYTDNELGILNAVFEYKSQNLDFDDDRNFDTIKYLSESILRDFDSGNLICINSNNKLNEVTK